MPGRKRIASIKRTVSSKRTRATGTRRGHPAVRRRRSARGGDRRRQSGWALLVGAAISLSGGVFAAVTMVGDTGRLDAAPLAIFGAFTLLAVLLALAGVRLLWSRSRRRS